MKYTIITINYNHREGLRETIKSVINQTYTDYEYIVIDGGSTDGSKEIIEENAKQIDYWISEPDKGIYNAMNKGIAQAHGEYINFMNSGDTFYDENVLSNVSNLMNGNSIVVGKDYDENPVTGKSFTTILPLRISMATFFMWTLPHQSAFIQRTLFQDSLYDESLRIVADWKFYMEKVAFEGHHVQLLDIIICRREQGGISNNQANKTIEERQSVLQELLPPGIYKDYASLANLDRSTLYKLLNLLDQDKPRKWITYWIKILHRIFSIKVIEHISY